MGKTGSPLPSHPHPPQPFSTHISWNQAAFPAAQGSAVPVNPNPAEIFNSCFSPPFPPCSDHEGETSQAPRVQLAAPFGACHSLGATLRGYSSPSALSRSPGPANAFLGLTGGTVQKHGGCSEARLPLRSTEGSESAAIINKASKAPEGESLKPPQKTTCILIPQQLFMRKPSPQHSQGSHSLPGCRTKPCPVSQHCPAEPLAPGEGPALRS